VVEKPAPKPASETKPAETRDKPAAKTSPDKKQTAAAPVSAVKGQNGIYTLESAKPEKAKPENTGAAE
jgi:hypothetical protein